MAPICGIFNFKKGGGASREDIELMMSSFAYQRFYKTLVREDETVALGRRKSNSASLDDSRPDGDDNLAIVADARLDNRRELFEKLEIPASERKNFSDESLLAAAYRKWGEDCPERLLGNFVFAVWDKTEKKLFLCHDHLGVKPLYYYTDAEKFIFATAPKAILAARGIEARLNRNKLVDIAVTRAKFLFAEETWFEKIFVLPAGTSLTVAPNGIRKRRFWEPQLEKSPPAKNEDEILEAFRELMFEVVGDHLPKDAPATALLSGGLDSSSIVGVAAKILEKQNRELHTLSAVLPDENDPVLKDERYYIDQMRVFPNVSINYVTDSWRGPFDNLEELIRENDSPLISSRHYLYSAFAEKAAQNSSQVILEGASGEMSATFDGLGSYAEMFLRLNWLRLWRELKLRQKVSGESIKYNLRANVFGLLIPDFVRRARRGKKTTPAAFKPKPTRSLLEENFAAELVRSIEPRMKDLGADDLRVSPFHRNNQYQIISNVFRKAVFTGLAFTDLGDLEFRFPFRDKRLLEFCLAVPYDLKVRDGYQRSLVRLGLDKILPPEIRWRTSKTPFSPDYIRRFNAQLPQLLDFLSSIKANDPVRRILNIPELIRMAKLPVKDTDYLLAASEVKNNAVPIGVYLIYFLRRFDEFKN